MYYHARDGQMLNPLRYGYENLWIVAVMSNILKPKMAIYDKSMKITVGAEHSRNNL